MSTFTIPSCGLGGALAGAGAAAGNPHLPWKGPEQMQVSKGLSAPGGKRLVYSMCFGMPVTTMPLAKGCCHPQPCWG